jgi:hypothetical protein
VFANPICEDGIIIPNNRSDGHFLGHWQSIQWLAEKVFPLQSFGRYGHKTKNSKQTLAKRPSWWHRTDGDFLMDWS